MNNCQLGFIHYNIPNTTIVCGSGKVYNFGIINIVLGF